MRYIRHIAILVILLALICPAQELDLRRLSNLCNTSGDGTTAGFRTTATGPMMELQTAFTNNGSKRATWDMPLNKNLSQCAGIRMTVFCSNPENASQFNLYIKSNGKWHNAKFEISTGNQWESVFISKAHFSPEENGDSWSNCSTMRIAAWKGSPGKLNMFISSLEIVHQNASVAIIRGYGNSKTQAVSLRHADNLCNAMNLAGIYPAVIDESDVAFTVLRPYKLLLVPYIDGLSPATNDTILQYMKLGGHAGFFHALPAKTAAILGTPIGKFTNASSIPDSIGGFQASENQLPGYGKVRQISTAFISIDGIPAGCKALAWWFTSKGNVTNHPAILETPKGFWMTHVYLNQDPVAGGMLFNAIANRFVPGLNQTAAKELLASANRNYSFSKSKNKEQAQSILNKAKSSYQAGKYKETSLLCLNVAETLKSATSTKAKARANEMRGIWCRYPAGLPGHSWKQTLQLLSAKKINTIFPYAASPYQTSYESRWCARTSGEGLSECVAAAKNTGISVHAWINCLGIEDAPDSVIRSFGIKGRLQLDPNGKQLPWLCPNNPENKQLLSRIVSELVAKHQVDGIHFDRIRYPGQNGCFCNHCKEAFEKYCGFKQTNWPDSVRTGEYQKKWTEFRVASINAILTEMVRAALTVRSTTFISAAVYPDGSQSRITVGQDWVTWCKNRQVSFVCPMNYHASTAQFTGDIKRQIAQTGKAGMLVPGIGTGPTRMTGEELKRQINSAREAHTYGFVIFDLGQREAFELLDFIAK